MELAQASPLWFGFEIQPATVGQTSGVSALAMIAGRLSIFLERPVFLIAQLRTKVGVIAAHDGFCGMLRMISQTLMIDLHVTGGLYPPLVQPSFGSIRSEVQNIAN